MNLAWRVGARGGQLGCLKRAACGASQIDRNYIIKVTREKLELTTEIARCRL
jgi:hypothetical protein